MAGWHSRCHSTWLQAGCPLLGVQRAGGTPRSVEDPTIAKEAIAVMVMAAAVQIKAAGMQEEKLAPSSLPGCSSMLRQPM
mmetsp:Transcript_35018/g.57955  ORF Transcript_35018/g.57955 Transcript_35018/m.57955 type:complete len:80 (+) Transcript_35018:273-512(+)